MQNFIISILQVIIKSDKSQLYEMNSTFNMNLKNKRQIKDFERIRLL
jgi:hypothetical protein